MPVYICNSSKGVIPEAVKPQIAEAITHIHCDVTGAPAMFVHVFFFDDAPFLPLHGKAVVFQGRIRQGRSAPQKEQIRARIAEAIVHHANVAEAAIDSSITDTPASWVMEGGELFPEPGQEAAWLAAFESKTGAKHLS